MRLHQGQAISGRKIANTSRLQNPEDLLHHPFGIRHVLIHLGADDHIKAAFRKADVQRVSHKKLQIRFHPMIAGEPHGGFVDVDAEDLMEMICQKIGDNAG